MEKKKKKRDLLQDHQKNTHEAKRPLVPILPCHPVPGLEKVRQAGTTLSRIGAQRMVVEDFCRIILDLGSLDILCQDSTKRDRRGTGTGTGRP